MSPRQHATLSWQLALAFALLTGICALAIGLYVVNARQHVGANYTALGADVVRAQQHPTLLRRELQALSDSPGNFEVNRFDNLLWRIPQHIQGVTHGLSRSQLNPADYADALERLQSVQGRLPDLQNRVDQTVAGDDPAALIELGFAIENDLAWAYSQLNELIHQAAAEQRLIMERLTLAIGVLVLIVMLVVGSLMLALLRLNRQRIRLSQLSRVDDLTGLRNRRYLLELAENLYQRGLRDSRPLSLLLIDIDYFKLINDRYGHPAGDRILKAFARALVDQTRQVDVVARLGGEEFCILMPDTDPPSALEVAERIRQHIQSLSIHHSGVSIPLTISLGVATGAAEDAAFDRLYSRADQALYVAKASGRNCSKVG